MWTWIGIGAGVLIGLPLVIATYGLMLPKAHSATRSARFAQPPQRVWEVIADFAAQPTWRGDVKRMERGPDRNGHPVWIEHNSTGRMPLEIIECTPPTQMVTKIADDKLPFGGTWTFRLKPTEEGCLLTITEDGEIYNPIFRVMAHHVFGYHATLESYLHNLGKKFGQPITFEAL